VLTFLNGVYPVFVSIRVERRLCGGQIDYPTGRLWPVGAFRLPIP
jgi:hypothetical protein